MRFTKFFARDLPAGVNPGLGTDIPPVVLSDVEHDNASYLRFGHDDTEISHSFAIVCVTPVGLPCDPIPCDLYFYDELTTLWFLCDTEDLTPNRLAWLDVSMLQPQPVAPPGAQIGHDLATGGYYVVPRMTLGGVYPNGTYLFAFGLDAQMAMSDVDAGIALLVAATHLEDTQHISGDRGIFDLAVRNDLAQTVLTNANGDYSGFAVNDRGQTLIRDVDIIVAGVALVAPGNTTAITCTSGINTVGVLATANSTVEAVFEGTRDGATWEAVYGIDRVSNLRVLGFAAGVNGSWAIPSAGYQQIRVRATAVGGAPTVTVALEGSAKPLISMPTPTADTRVSGAVTAGMGTGSVAVNTNGASTCVVQTAVSGGAWGTAVVTFERFDPNLATWEATAAYPTNGGLEALTATAPGIWVVPCAGFSQVRATVVAVNIGTITMSLESSTGVQLVTQLNDHRATGIITVVSGAGNVEVNTNGYSTCVIQTDAAGAWGNAVVYFERFDPDLLTWAAAVGYPPEGGLGLPSVNVDGVWIVPCAGFSRVRARAEVVDTTDITLSLESSPGIEIVTPPGDHRTTGTVTTGLTGSVEINTNGYSTCTIQAACTGWGTGVVWFERYDPDLATWATALGYPPDGGVGITNTTANGVWIVPCAGFSRVRARVAGVTAANMILYLESSPGIQMVFQPSQFLRTNSYEFPAINQDANATYNVAPTVTDHNYGTLRGDGTAVWASNTTLTLTTTFTLLSSQIRKVIVVTAAGAEVRVLENGRNGVRITLSAGASPYTLTVAGAGTIPLPATAAFEVLWDGPDKAVVAEDAAAVSGEYINKLGAVRRDVPVSSAGSDGDWATINEDADGYLYVRDKAYDAASNANRVAEIAPVWSRNVQTPVALIAAAQNLTAAFADLGPEIATQGYTKIGLWLELHIADSTNVRVRCLAKHTAAGTNEYLLPISAVDVGGTPYNIKIEGEYIELNVDADQLICLNFDVFNWIPYAQFQVMAEVVGVTAGHIDEAHVTYGYGG